MDASEVRRRFADFVRRPQGGFRLAEAALVLAQEAYPSLDVAAYLRRIDAMAAMISTRLGLELDPQRIVAAINAYLFDEQGFHGNQEDYYDVRNSFLNDVLERKTGIPITLSVLYIEIGRQVGLPTVGIGLPGHFIVRYTAHPTPFWIDPFHGGQVLTRDDCQARVEQLYGPSVAWHEEYLHPVSDHDILVRMLYNLKGIYVQRGDYRQAMSVVERLLLLRPDLPDEVRDRGLLAQQLGRLEVAVDDLQRYLRLSPQAPDASLVRQRITMIRQQLQG